LCDVAKAASTTGLRILLVDEVKMSPRFSRIRFVLSDMKSWSLTTAQGRWLFRASIIRMMLSSIWAYQS
jgi:hypothetical protein